MPIQIIVIAVLAVVTIVLIQPYQVEAYGKKPKFALYILDCIEKLMKRSQELCKKKSLV